MPRKGRELELLIEKLEKMALPDGASIYSPGILVDKITGQDREVDVLIEDSIGTSNIKIVIECRDRSAVQDTTWIEQLYCKVQDLNVHKTIAVSSSGFSDQAIYKAKHYNIETRTISEIDLDTVKSWWQVKEVGYYSQNKMLVGAEIGLENPDLGHAVLGKRLDEKILSRKGDSRKYSILEVVPNLDDHHWAACTVNGPGVPFTIDAKYENVNDQFFILSDNKKCNVTSILFKLQLSVVWKKLTPSKLQEYADNTKPISQIIEFGDLDIQGKKTMQFIKGSDGSIRISLGE